MRASNSILDVCIGGDALSQGKKHKPESALFIPTDDVYRHIPKTHFYETLGRVLDLSFVRDLTRPVYAAKLGRPSLDPVVFFKCMLVAFFENITYDTELEFRIADSLLLRKFLGYGLDEATPDESTLRKTRQRMPEEAFRAVGDYVLEVCQKNGLLKGRIVGTDGTYVDANASMASLRHKELCCTYDEFVVALRRQDNPDATREEARAADQKREEKASNADWQSKTDPDSRIMQHRDGHTHLSYKVDTCVDLETGVIISAGADLANLSDQADCLGRVDEAIEALNKRGLAPSVIVADKGHHTGKNLAGIQERGLIPMIASPNQPASRPGFDRCDFSYDAASDSLVCPAGETLRRSPRVEEGRRYYKGKGSVCSVCPHFGVCTKSKGGRTVVVSDYEKEIAANRQRVRNAEARPLMQIRRQRGEAPFGYFKGYGAMRRMSGRGLSFAVKKTIMAMVGWNLLLVISAATRAASSATVLLHLATAIWRRIREAIEQWPLSLATRHWRNQSPFEMRLLLNNIEQKAPLSGAC
jgi:transposase